MERPRQVKTANLIRRAIKEQWPTPENNRADLMRRVEEVLLTSPDDRTVVAAFRALLEAAKTNQAGLRLLFDLLSGQKLEELEGIANALRSGELPIPPVLLSGPGGAAPGKPADGGPDQVPGAPG